MSFVGVFHVLDCLLSLCLTFCLCVCHGLPPLATSVLSLPPLSSSNSSIFNSCIPAFLQHQPLCLPHFCHSAYMIMTPLSTTMGTSPPADNPTTVPNNSLYSPITNTIRLLINTHTISHSPVCVPRLLPLNPPCCLPPISGSFKNSSSVWATASSPLIHCTCSCMLSFATMYPPRFPIGSSFVAPCLIPPCFFRLFARLSAGLRFGFVCKSTHC